MHLSLLATNTMIWTVAFVLQCVLVYLIFRRGIAPRFPVFSSLLIFQPVRAALLFGLSGHIRSSVTISLYGVFSFIDAAVQLMVAVELALHMISGVGGWTRFRALLCLLLLGAALVFTSIAISLVPGRVSADRLQIFAWFTLFALFGAMLKGSRSYNLTNISAGFSLFSLVQFSALAGRTVALLHRNAIQYAAWSYVSAIGYLAIVVFWIITLRRESERVRIPVPSQNSDLP